MTLVPPAAGPLAHYVLCRDAARIEQWERRRAELPGVQLHLLTGFKSMYAFITHAIDDCTDDHLVVSHDDVVFGFDFAARVASLVADLETRYPRWGVAGNAGVGIDGKSFQFHVKDPWSTPSKAAGPKPVVAVDGNLMIVNRKNFLASRCDYPDLGGFHGYDLVLCLECIRRGLLVIVDQRLLTVHRSSGNKGEFWLFAASEGFLGYVRARFSDHALPTMMGVLPIPATGHAPAVGVEALADVYDRALSMRPADFAASLEVIVFDDASQGGEERFDELAAFAPLVRVTRRHVAVDAPNARGEAIATALRDTTSTHVWFLPRDATIERSALRQVARTLASGTCCVASLGHRIADGGGGADAVRSATQIVHRAFAFDRFPYWAAIYPAAVLRNRIDELQPPLDQLPDLLAPMALTSSATELVLVHATVVRALQEPVRPLTRDGYGTADEWDAATRMAFVLGTPALGSPVLWNLAEAGAPFLWNRRARFLLANPSRIIRAAIGVGTFLETLVKGLATPGRYLRPRVALLSRHLRAADLRNSLRALTNTRKN